MAGPYYMFKGQEIGGSLNRGLLHVSDEDHVVDVADHDDLGAGVADLGQAIEFDFPPADVEEKIVDGSPDTKEQLRAHWSAGMRGGV